MVEETVPSSKATYIGQVEEVEVLNQWAAVKYHLKDDWRRNIYSM